MSTVTVATWNLENLFRPADGDSAPTLGVYDAKFAALAAVITDLAPDVLAVQEVGTPAALDDLADRLPGTWHTEVAAPDGRGIRVGVLSGLPVREVEQSRDFPPVLAPVQVDDAGTTLNQMGRPALRVRVPWRPPPVPCREARCWMWSRCTLSRNCSPSPAAGSTRATRTSGPGTRFTPCTGGPLRPLPCAPT